MRTGMFVFAHDLRDEGVERVAASGVDELVFAAAYHAARDLAPHARGGRLRWMEPGVTYFRPDGALWEGARLTPVASALCSDGADPLDEAVASGLDVHAWVVYLHSDRLGFQDSDCAPRTAFGDRLLTDLCPAHPDVRDYAVRLTRDVAARGVRSIRAEALHHGSFGHGFHHERAFVALDGRTQHLLGLCFCAHCVAAAGAAGLDAERLAAQVRQEVDVRLAGDAPAAPVDLEAYMSVRCGVVTSLVSEVVDAAAGCDVVVMDPSGAAKGYADGLPSGGPAAELAGAFGLDLGAVAGVAAGVQVLAYARDPARVAADLEAYDNAGASPLHVALRPMWPDCDGPSNLKAKVEAVRAAGAASVDFYHYGLAPAAALDWVAAALS